MRRESAEARLGADEEWRDEREAMVPEEAPVLTVKALSVSTVLQLATLSREQRCSASSMSIRFDLGANSSRPGK